jgi:hypothetical protein
MYPSFPAAARARPVATCRPAASSTRADGPAPVAVSVVLAAAVLAAGAGSATGVSVAVPLSLATSVSDASAVSDAAAVSACSTAGAAASPALAVGSASGLVSTAGSVSDPRDATEARDEISPVSSRSGGGSRRHSATATEPVPSGRKATSASRSTTACWPESVSLTRGSAPSGAGGRRRLTSPFVGAGGPRGSASPPRSDDVVKSSVTNESTPGCHIPAQRGAPDVRHAPCRGAHLPRPSRTPPHPASRHLRTAEVTDRRGADAPPSGEIHRSGGSSRRKPQVSSLGRPR